MEDYTIPNLCWGIDGYSQAENDDEPEILLKLGWFNVQVGLVKPSDKQIASWAQPVGIVL